MGREREREEGRQKEKGREIKMELDGERQGGKNKMYVGEIGRTEVMRSGLWCGEGGIVSSYMVHLGSITATIANATIGGMCW